MKTIFLWFSRLLFISLLVVSGARFTVTWRWNLWAVRLLKNDQTTYPSEIKSCAQKWLSSVAAGKRGDLTSQRQIWIQSLTCSQHYLSLVYAIAPKDQELAQLTTQLYPDSKLAWFWLGETYFYTDRPASRQAYLHVVELDPRNGVSWCRLGWVYEGSQDYETAAQDYSKCCRYGDPGKNGCYGAGRMMEKLGNLNQALTYYRLSHDPAAQKRAVELEKLLHP